MARVPSLQKTTALVSRALSLPPESLVAAFVPAGARDLPQIVGLRRQIIGADLIWDDPSYLAWRYHLGHADRGRGECWVVRRGDEVLAMLGSERITVLHQGRRVHGLSVMDIAVRPDLEGVGLGVWMAMQLCEQADCVLAVGSNVNSRAIVTRVFSRLPDRRSYAHPIDFRPMFRRRFGTTVRAAVLARLARWGMLLWRGAGAATARRSIRLEPLLRFDASIRSLVERSRTDLEVSVDRDEAFLNWRLFDSPRSTYSVWAARQGADLVGYMAWRIALARDGTRSLVIEDMLVHDLGGAAVLRRLLCKAFDEACVQGCERISTIACHPGNEKVLRQLGFFAHRADAETLSVRCRDPQLSAAIEAGAPWHLTGANTDRDE